MTPSPDSVQSSMSSQRLTCSWCKTVLREGQEPGSHGICRACERAVSDETERDGV